MNTGSIITYSGYQKESLKKNLPKRLPSVSFHKSQCFMFRLERKELFSIFICVFDLLYFL